MIKKIILLMFLGLCSISRAEVRTDSNQLTWFMGFADACVYDVYWQHSDNKNLTMNPATLFWLHPKYQEDEAFFYSQKSTYVMTKIGIGLMTGAALSFYNAQKYERNPSWDDVVFGGLGGLTSVVIHF